MTPLAKLKAEYLERATAKIMAMPQANFIKPNYYRSVGDIACQALAFQAKNLMMADFAAGIDHLLDLIGEEDLVTLIEDLRDDPVKSSNTYITLFGSDRLRGRQSFGLNREETDTEVSLSGTYGNYVTYDNHGYIDGYLDFAEERVPQDNGETDRGEAVRAYIIERLGMLLGDRFSVAAMGITDIVCKGALHHISKIATPLTMQDRRIIDKIIENEAKELCAMRDIDDSIIANPYPAVLPGKDDTSIEAIQARINARLSDGAVSVIKIDRKDGYPTYLHYRVCGSSKEYMIHDYSHSMEDLEKQLYTEAKRELIKTRVEEEIGIHAVFARQIIKELDRETSRFLNRVIDSRGIVVSSDNGRITARLQNGMIVGSFEINNKVRWKDGKLILPMVMTPVMTAVINDRAKAKTPMPLSEIVELENDTPLSRAHITGAYPGKKGTTLTMTSETIDIDSLMVPSAKAA